MRRDRMHERMQTNRMGSRLAGGGLLALLLSLGPSKAFGQTAPPGEARPAAASNPGEAAGARAPLAAPPESPPPLQAPPPAPPPAPAPAPGPAPAPTELPFGTVPKGPVAPVPPPAMPNIDYGGRLRSAVRFQGV